MTAPSAKFGTVEIKENFINGNFHIAKYEGELNDDNKPHGKGTLTTDTNKRYYNIEFKDGTPLLDSKFTFISENGIKIEGRLINLGLDSLGYQVDCWTVKGIAMFPKIYSSFEGIMKIDYTFIRGVFRNALLVVQIETREGFIENGKYKPLNRCLMITDLFEKRTYYKVDDKMFHNRNGVTYVFQIEESEFILELHKSGTVDELTKIVLPRKEDIYDCFLGKYISDEELTRMAGF